MAEFNLVECLSDYTSGKEQLLIVTENQHINQDTLVLLKIIDCSSRRVCLRVSSSLLTTGWHSVLEVWLVSHNKDRHSPSWDKRNTFSGNSHGSSQQANRSIRSNTLSRARSGTAGKKYTMWSFLKRNSLVIIEYSSVALWHSDPSLNSQYVHYLTQWWPITAHSAEVSRLGLMGYNFSCISVSLLHWPWDSSLAFSMDAIIPIGKTQVGGACCFIHPLHFRTVMCATALPAKRAQVFAIARFYQVREVLFWLVTYLIWIHRRSRGRFSSSLHRSSQHTGC